VLQKSRLEPAIYPSLIQQRQRRARWGSELAFPSGRASISFIAFLLSKYVAACSILRLVELAFDPAAHVARAFGLRQTLVEHELGNARRRRDFRLQDIGLAREQHALGAQLGADLIGTRLSSENMSLRRPTIRNGSRICVWLLRAKPATLPSQNWRPIMPSYSPELIQTMRVALDEVMTKIPMDQATPGIKAHMAELMHR